MKEEALSLIAELNDPAQKLNRLREYMQAFILRSLHESEAFHSLAFVGGTALRFLHGLPRFSEDLDFAVEQAEGYRPRVWLDKLKRDMAHAVFDTDISWNDRKTVHTAWIRTARLLKDAGLAAMPTQKLSIKLEIDTRPPVGGISLRSVITRHAMFVVCHHDLPSLMAGKLHALITRPYPKGRDWYDLTWYRSRHPPVEPNLVLLQNALDQTEGRNAHDAASWREHTRRRLSLIKAGLLSDDVRPFLERPQDSDLITRENLEAILRG